MNKEQYTLTERTPQSSYGVTSKTYSFWRPPAGYEDTHIEPGTIPGTYGSPVNPPAGMAALAAQHANSLFLYANNRSSPNTPVAATTGLPSSYSSSHALSEQTPRIKSMSLQDMTGVATPEPDSPGAHIARDSTPTTIASPPRYRESTIKHSGALSPMTAQQKQDILDRDAMLEKDRYASDNLDEGDSCEWTNAKPDMLRNLSPNRAQSSSEATEAEQQ